MSRFYPLINAGNAKTGVQNFENSTRVALNATAGTGIATKTASSSFAATSAMMNIYNSADPSATSPGVEKIIPLYLRITNTVTNTAATDFRLKLVLDKTNRYTSGGTALTGYTCGGTYGTAVADETASKATIYFGDLVTTAVSDEKTLSQPIVRNSIFTAGERAQINFGSDAVAPAVADGIDQYVNVPPIVINPGHNLSIHAWGASQTGGSPAFEVEFCYIEFPHSS